MSESVQHLRLSLGPSTLDLFLDRKSAESIITSAMNNKSGIHTWVEVTDVSGNEVRVRTSDILSIQTIKMTKARKSDPDTIEIKALAECAGVHPVTISRLFGPTLKQSMGKKRKFSRATRDTAEALYAHLRATREDIKKDLRSELLSLFKNKS